MSETFLQQLTYYRRLRGNTRYPESNALRGAALRVLLGAALRSVIVAYSHTRPAFFSRARSCRNTSEWMTDICRVIEFSRGGETVFGVSYISRTRRTYIYATAVT